MVKNKPAQESKNTPSRSLNYIMLIIALIAGAATIIAAYIGSIKPENIISIIISPEKATIPIGDNIQVEAVGLTKENVNILDLNPDWTCSNPDIGTLTINKGSKTTFKAKKEGITEIKAKIGSIYKTAQIAVINETGKNVYVGTTLASGYNMGVNTSSNITDWLFDSKQGFMEMDYPQNQSWGAVFITVGEPKRDVSAKSIEDLSKFKYLVLDLKGKVGDESIEIGLKDNTDPDNGSETKIKILNLTKEWQHYQFELKKFETADPTRLHVVIEFVFSGPSAQTVYFRNIKYMP